MTAAALAHFANLSQEDADEIVAVRQRFGGLTSVDDLVVHAGLNPQTAEQLRDYAIFL